jgi:hypothetical protein
MHGCTVGAPPRGPAPAIIRPVATAISVDSDQRCCRRRHALLADCPVICFFLGGLACCFVGRSMFKMCGLLQAAGFTAWSGLLTCSSALWAGFILPGSPKFGVPVQVVRPTSLRCVDTTTLFFFLWRLVKMKSTRSSG